MILYYDIDGTLTDPIGTVWTPDDASSDWQNCHGKDWIMPPNEERLGDLRQRHREGHEIVIWSCRTNPTVMGLDFTAENLNMLHRLVKEWLEHYAVPYERIESIPKPFFTFLIDDRAVNPVMPAEMLLLRYSRLRRFVSHDHDCKANEMMEAWQEDTLCTCGLSDILNEDWTLGIGGSVRGGKADA